LPSDVPQKKHYGSVLDYLEAKYVRGVMLETEANNTEAAGESGEVADDDERGSVYSESSFLDDSLLRRDVAEQVLSATTHTKLELEADDEDFFVNVGNLEVEDHDLMDYDPVEEEKGERKPTEKKRKKPASNSDDIKKPLKKKAAPADKKETTPSKKPAKKKIEPLTEEAKTQVEALKKRAEDLKAKSDQVFRETRDAINKMTEKELPRKKKNEKVSIVVPEGRNPGDDITFSNPHVAGQKLRVKIPKNASAGGKFVVSVPVPSKLNPENDNNKFGREMQDQLDSFSHAYDDWCHAEASWREMDPTQEKFALHHERMNKFEKLLSIFPSDLVTPIDAAYLRKIVRRARQNKHKRVKTQQRLGELGNADPQVKREEEDTKPSLEIQVPGKGVVFHEVNLEI